MMMMMKSVKSEVGYVGIALAMKKRSEATQTLRAGSSKADPQTNTHTNRQGRLQYTAHLSA